MVLQLLSYAMDPGNQVQKLEDVISISHSANAFGKNIRPNILLLWLNSWAD